MTAPALGFVGTGFHAQINLLPAARAAGVELVALASRDAERSAAALAGIGSSGRGFGGVDDMLVGTPSLDRVIVCAQPADQPAIVRRLLGAGLHVLAEKPLGGDAQEAQDLADLARANGAVLRTAFMKRFASAAIALRELLDSGDLGAVLSFDIAFAAETSAFAPTRASFIRLAAIHHIDLLRFLFGEVERVDVVASGTAETFTIIATVRLASGAVGTLRLTNSAGSTSEIDEVAVTAEHGTLAMSNTREITIQKASDSPDWQRLSETTTRLQPAVSTMSGAGQDLVLRGFVGEIRAFATEEFAADDDCAESNVRTMRLVDEIVRQATASLRSGATAQPATAIQPAASQNPVEYRTVMFGPAGPIRDAMNGAILRGEKNSSSNLLVAIEAMRDTVPTAGETRVLLGSNDEPVALLHYDRVSQRLLGDVDEPLAALEHRTLDDWHAAHRDFWSTLTDDVRTHLGDPAWTLSDDEVVVTTQFRATPWVRLDEEEPLSRQPSSPTASIFVS
ncbi:Gfo/Idh/MocA family oxidoreductase [Plantibacter sp. YIM 135347]|uniref:Gfo/Idh/MocA family oxidoreductase n=1 Tax=Plantibacter sp. YIM 135347 TaxID=3423919 RepID=UPI003D34893E